MAIEAVTNAAISWVLKSSCFSIFNDALGRNLLAVTPIPSVPSVKKAVIEVSNKTKLP